MTESFRVVLLAVIQGITEFLPVSSSGHLVLAEHWLKVSTSGIVLEVTLHVGTLVSVLLFYRKRIAELLSQCFSGKGEGRSYAGAVVLGSIPAAVAYACFGKKIESYFTDPHAVAIFLCITGVLLFTLLAAKKASVELSVGRGGLVCIAQAFALLPGISRSGSTIVAARHLGIAPAKAAEFSLLLSVPALFGAMAVKVIEVARTGLAGLSPSDIGIGFVVSAAVGYAAIACLVKMLSAGKLWLFGVYCIAAGAISWLML